MRLVLALPLALGLSLAACGDSATQVVDPNDPAAVADAMASRLTASANLAGDRLRQSGVQMVNTEMAIFELLGRAGTAEFKQLSALIR